MSTASFFHTRWFIVSLCILLTGCQEGPSVLRSKTPPCDQITSAIMKIEFEFIPKLDTIPVRAPQSGILESYSIASNTYVGKGIVIAHIENRNAYLHLREQKSSLKSKLESLDFPLILSQVEQKWRDYGKSIQLDNLLPQTPEFSYQEEIKHLEATGVVSAINEIILAEIRMLPYFIKSPEIGKFHQYLKSGSTVNKGDVIGVIVTNKGTSIKPLADMKLHTSKLQFAYEGKVIISYDPQKQEFTRMKHRVALRGKHTLQSTQPLFRIPNTAIQHGQIRLLEKGHVFRKQITPLIHSNDYTYVHFMQKQICLIH